MLIVHRNLKKTGILSGSDIPSISLGIEDQQYVRLPTQTLFKKIKPVFDTVVFDKNTKPYIIALSETYLSCNGPVSQSDNNGIGIKTIPIITDNMFVIAFKITSVGSNYPLIGFCDKDKSRLDRTYVNTVLFDLKQNRIKYTSPNRHYSIQLPRRTIVKTNDIVHIAVSKELNQLWVGVNDNWYTSHPNTINTSPYVFINNDMGIAEPTPFVVPNGSVVDIIDYPYVIPTMYTQAKSVSVLDWYKDGLFKREDYQ